MSLWDHINDQPNDDSFCSITERVQSNAALAITGTSKGTSQWKIYKELGFESLKFRRWFRHVWFFYKLRSTQTPMYLHNFIPSGSCIDKTHVQAQVETYYCRIDLFEYSFFPYNIVEWYKLETTLRNAKLYLIFRNSLLKIGRPIQRFY